MIFPCTQIPENLKFDIYNNDGPSYQFQGTVNHRLNVISDVKQAREYLKNLPANKAVVSEKTKVTHNFINDSPSSLSLNHNPYTIAVSDPQSAILQKFLSLVALGPLPKPEIAKNLVNISSQDLNLLCSNYLQTFDRNDTFIQDDVFPNQHNSPSAPDETCLILKDKSYKDLKPWHWKWYNNFERNLILNNINNALTRLGYLETHPLRRKIVNEPNDTLPSNDDSKLGGGFIINRKNTPHAASSLASSFNTFKRSQTESPKLSDTNISPVRKLSNKNSALVNESPVRTKKTHSLSSSSSDDDDYNKKKFKSNDDSTSPSSLNDDNSSNDEKNPKTVVSSQKKLQYYNNLAVKFKLNYKQYELLYNSLVNKKVMNIQDRKRKLIKLFELHSKLSEWKKILWDYHNENNLKKNIMNLSKHKKTTTTRPEPSGVKAMAANSKFAQKLKPKLSLDY